MDRDTLHSNRLKLTQLPLFISGTSFAKGDTGHPLLFSRVQRNEFGDMRDTRRILLEADRYRHYILEPREREHQANRLVIDYFNRYEVPSNHFVLREEALPYSLTDNGLGLFSFIKKYLSVYFDEEELIWENDSLVAIKLFNGRSDKSFLFDEDHNEIFIKKEAPHFNRLGMISKWGHDFYFGPNDKRENYAINDKHHTRMNMSSLKEWFDSAGLVGLSQKSISILNKRFLYKVLEVLSFAVEIKMMIEYLELPDELVSLDLPVSRSLLQQAYMEYRRDEIKETDEVRGATEDGPFGQLSQFTSQITRSGLPPVIRQENNPLGVSYHQTGNGSVEATMPRRFFPAETLPSYEVERDRVGNESGSLLFEQTETAEEENEEETGRYVYEVHSAGEYQYMMEKMTREEALWSDRCRPHEFNVLSDRLFNGYPFSLFVEVLPSGRKKLTWNPTVRGDEPTIKVSTLMEEDLTVVASELGLHRTPMCLEEGTSIRYEINSHEEYQFMMRQMTESGILWFSGDDPFDFDPSSTSSSMVYPYVLTLKKRNNESFLLWNEDVPSEGSAIKVSTLMQACDDAQRVSSEAEEEEVIQEEEEEEEEILNLNPLFLAENPHHTSFIIHNQFEYDYMITRLSEKGVRWSNGCDLDNFSPLIDYGCSFPIMLHVGEDIRLELTWSSGTTVPDGMTSVDVGLLMFSETASLSRQTEQKTRREGNDDD